MTHQYELMVILNPEIDERQVPATLDKFLKVITTDGGSIDNVDIWGKRRLAYEIRHQTEAFYFVITFEASAEALAETQRVLAITDGVMRFMAVNRVVGSSPAQPEETTHPPVEATA